MLADIIREMREERGRKGGFDDSRLRERVEVLGPEVSLDVLRDAVSTAIVDRLGVTWDERYGELKRYKERFGDCKVPRGWSENPKLAMWITKQRFLERAGLLAPERKTRLNKLGLAWEPHDSAWDTMFTELQHYKERFGDCNVPYDWSENEQLGWWVGTQRIFQRKGQLSAARKNKLDALGFEWEPYDSDWEAMFTELQRYKERVGDCNVPQKFPENPRLGRWVAHQQRDLRDGVMSPERKARLDELDFVWNRRDSRWEAMFTELKRYKARFGDCNVIYGWEENPRLGSWVHNQRTLKTTGRLSSVRMERLDELGFVWVRQAKKRRVLPLAAE